ncbi:MAG: hypothetical protein KBS64_08060 [Treponema sp.]|nr:hypothetical protein [Candidatus Treponema equi]
MKKSIFGVVSVLAASIFVSCGSTKAPKLTNEFTEAKSAGNHAEYIDWQGLAANGELPQWYSHVLNARSEGALRKALSEDGSEYGSYRLWAVNAMGNDLEAIKTITDSFDIQSAVSQSISMNVAQVADRQRETEGSGSKITQESKSQVVDMITKNVTLNGLERITSYWAQYEIQNKSGEVVKPAVYSYVLVMGMPKDKFNKQLDAAMKNIENNANQDENLRALATIAVARLRDPQSLQTTVSANLDLTGNGPVKFLESNEPEAVLY